MEKRTYPSLCMDQWELVAVVRVVFFFNWGKEICIGRRKSLYCFLPLFLQQRFCTYLPLILHFSILINSTYNHQFQQVHSIPWSQSFLPCIMYHFSPLNLLLYHEDVGSRFQQNTCSYLSKHVMSHLILMTQCYENIKPWALL